jgi:hypothetical protein
MKRVRRAAGFYSAPARTVNGEGAKKSGTTAERKNRRAAE